VVNVFNNGLLNVHLMIRGCVALLILSVPYILTKKTGKTIFMKWMPFLYMLFQVVMLNYSVFYALSEEG